MICYSRYRAPVLFSAYAVVVGRNEVQGSRWWRGFSKGGEGGGRTFAPLPPPPKSHGGHTSSLNKMQPFLHSLLLFALVTAAASLPSDGFDADVIVVGGGISGLYAAHELQYNSNLSVLVNRPEIITVYILRAKTSANLPLQGARGPRSPRRSNAHRDTPHTSSHRSALTLHRAQVPADNGDGIDLGAHWIGRTQHHVIEVRTACTWVQSSASRSRAWWWPPDTHECMRVDFTSYVLQFAL